MIAFVNRWYSTLGVLFVLGNLPLLWAALRALSERDYAAGGLLVFAAASTGHLGLELLALGRRGATEVVS